MASAGNARVHLHLRGPLDDDGAYALRQQLATCLSSGVKDIAVHVESQPELGLAVLRTLQGAADYLASCGGGLTLMGAQPRVLEKLHMYELDRLLQAAFPQPAPVAEPYPAEPVPATRATAREASQAG